MPESSAFPVLIMKQEPRGGGTALSSSRSSLDPGGTARYPNTPFLLPLAGVAEEATCPDGIWHGETRREKGRHPLPASRSHYARMTAEEMMGQQPSWPSMRVTSSRNRVAGVTVRSALNFRQEHILAKNSSSVSTPLILWLREFPQQIQFDRAGHRAADYVLLADAWLRPENNPKRPQNMLQSRNPAPEWKRGGNSSFDAWRGSLLAPLMQAAALLWRLTSTG